MNSDFKTYLNHYAKFSNKDFDEIMSVVKVKKAKKGLHILQSGKICDEFIFILSGCTRVYFITDNKEITVWIGFSNDIGSDIQSFISSKPANFSIEAIQDIEYISISKASFDKLVAEMPAWETFTRKLWGEIIVNVIDRLTAFQFQSAEQRYSDLIKTNPDYLQLIPQKYLASFLGVTVTSLSRIRKKNTHSLH
jgi:CRP-like cAMP-binding protein